VSRWLMTWFRRIDVYSVRESRIVANDSGRIALGRRRKEGRSMSSGHGRRRFTRAE
jgi:hypothetical protein